MEPSTVGRGARRVNRDGPPLAIKPAAAPEVNAGGSPLNADGTTNQIYWGWRRTAKRIKEISDTFASVWGQSAINARVRPVLSG